MAAETKQQIKNKGHQESINQESISRLHPMGILFLIDKSYSMSFDGAGTNKQGFSKEFLVNSALSKFLWAMDDYCEKDGEYYNYFYVSIRGYNDPYVDSAPEVKNLIKFKDNCSDSIKNARWLSLKNLVKNAVFKDNSFDFNAMESKGETPMYSAFSDAEKGVQEFNAILLDLVKRANPGLPERMEKEIKASFCIIHISDGVNTEDKEPGEIMERIKKTEYSRITSPISIMNIGFEVNNLPELAFPSETEVEAYLNKNRDTDGFNVLQEDGLRFMFDSSSELTEKQVEMARGKNIEADAGSKAFFYNASDPTLLFRLLEIGTQITMPSVTDCRETKE